MQESKGENKVKLGLVQELSYHEETFHQVQDDSDSEKCSQSDKNLDQVDH